jgi:hypothetical protein
MPSLYLPELKLQEKKSQKANFICSKEGDTGTDPLPSQDSLRLGKASEVI